MANIIRNRRILEHAAASGGLIPADEARLTVLENNVYKIAYFEEVSSASGTITKPTGSTILLDQFPGGVDALVSTVSTIPTGDNPITAGGAIVDVASFDALGNYTLTGTPSAFPVAIIYILSITALNYVNLNINKTLEEELIYVKGPASSTDNAIARWNGTTGDILQNSGATISDAGSITATNLSGTNTGDQLFTASGDATAPSSASNLALTLATVNGNVGSFTNASITVNAKGLITAASSGAASEVPLTFSSGLTRTVNTVTNNLITGITGGQTIIGGTAVGDGLSYKGTTANGTLTAAAHTFLVGNNGATTALTILNNARILIGTATTADVLADVLIGTSAITQKGLVIQGKASQSANLFQIQDSTGTAMFKVLNTGELDIVLGGASSTGIDITTTTVACQIALTSTASNSAARLILSSKSGSTNKTWFIGPGVLNNGANFNLNIGSNFPLNINENGQIGLLGKTAPTSYLDLAAGTTAASTAPLKFTSGPLMTTPEIGAVEFLTDKYYATITTGTARTEITLNNAALTSGTIPIATTNGRLTDSTFTSTTLGTFVVGPASATDNALARFDGTTGKIIQNSVILIGDTGILTGTLTFGDNVTFADGKNIIFNATTGTKIGTATSQKIGFFNATPIIQPASADQEPLAYVVGLPSNTLQDVDDHAGGVDLTTTNDNFASCAAKITALNDALTALGLIKGTS